MTSYRVSLKIDFIVNINPENELADSRPPLQGDTLEAAVNRASWVWLEGMKLTSETRKSLGVGRSFSRRADVEVMKIEAPAPELGSKEPDTGSAGFFTVPWRQKEKRVGASPNPTSCWA